LKLKRTMTVSVWKSLTFCDYIPPVPATCDEAADDGPGGVFGDAGGDAESDEIKVRTSTSVAKLDVTGTQMTTPADTLTDGVWIGVESNDPLIALYTGK